MPDMPRATPGDQIGGGTVALFLGIVALAGVSENVQLAAIAGATIVAGLTVWSHAKLRETRNVTARVLADKE